MDFIERDREVKFASLRHICLVVVVDLAFPLERALDLVLVLFDSEPKCLVVGCEQIKVFAPH